VRWSATASAPTFSTTSRVVRILGAGPAGSIAALSGLNEGAPVELIERSRFPRHKVCGEFLSPEIAPVLHSVGALDAFLEARPHRITRMRLVFGNRVKQAFLPEAAFGLSRYTYDDLLFRLASERGASLVTSGDADVIAAGRCAEGEVRGQRLFGFKAHFRGPADDAVELYFLRRAYVGVNCVEQGVTNVCGLAPEDLLAAHGFDPDLLLQGSEALRERLSPLSRTMKWIFTGPLAYTQRWQRTDSYLAGDALSFVDPFTGSGLLCAAVTGSLAGAHAARGTPVDVHRDRCWRALGRPFVVSSMLRSAAGTAWAEHLAAFVPSQLLFRLTRPARYTHSDG
jgi:menaquinone-9 beta-reductase